MALTLRKDSGPICFSNIWRAATWKRVKIYISNSILNKKSGKHITAQVAIWIQQGGEVQERKILTDFHDLIFPYKPMHWVPYKSLQEAEQLKAVAPPLSTLQTAQFACRLIYKSMWKMRLAYLTAALSTHL